MSTQSNVLKILLEHQEAPVSGARIGADLNVSRTAIWKAINELKKLGHQIESIPNKGYRYMHSDILSREGLLADLGKAVPSLNIIVEEELASTNQTLKKMAIDGAPSPTLLVTRRQTATRGRFGRAYFAPTTEEGIYFSLLLNPGKTLPDVTQYTLITAVAMVKTLEQYTSAAVAIKWVNDIYLQGKKVSGILSEAISDFETQTISAIIIGVGTNFKIPTSNFPLELQERATSLFPDGQATATRSQVIATFIQTFFALLAGPPEAFLAEYRRHSFVLNQRVSFKQNQVEYSGIARTITSRGELVVELADGSQHTLSSGEISLSAYPKM